MTNKISNFLFLFIFFSTFQILASDKVYINQVGYLPSSNKYVFTSVVSDSFSILDRASGNIIFRDKLNLSKSIDPASGLTLYKGDFSNLRKAGTYIIITSSGESSYEFFISDTLYHDVYRKVLKGFYYQRCGIDLTLDFAGIYTHPKCHSKDGIFHSSTKLNGSYPTIGGWHDAGDYGKYVINAGITIGTMLLGYEIFPNRFSFDDLNIQESKNGIPDILDEVRFELEWLLKMQDKSTGGVFTKLTRENFEGFVMPQSDFENRYLYEISTAATGDFVAMMAKAARIYSKYDQFFANTCLQSAISGWNYLSSHNTIIPTGGFKNPSGTNTGEYGDGDDRDERLWAASELFLTTGIDTYHDYFKNHYQDKGLFSSAMSWQDVNSLALLSYLCVGQTNKDNTVKNKILASLNSYCQNLVFIKLSDGFDLVMGSDEYYWGSNSILLNKAILLYICGQYVNTTLYTELAIEQLNYIFGINYYNISFVTGTGSKKVMKPHHRPSIADGIINPVPGLLAGGPNKNLEDNVLKTNFNKNTPSGQCYIDNQDSYASNEICINWNAPLVFMTGVLCSNNTSSHIKKYNNAIPDNIKLNQNYPNPFNHSTNIKYSLIKPENISLKIYDLLGRKVYNKQLGYKEPGNYNITWDAKGNSGNIMGSGVYFYCLEGEKRTEMKKLVLLF